MARKLPWAADAPTSTYTTAGASSSRPQKRIKTEAPTPKSTAKPEARSGRIDNFLKAADGDGDDTPTPSPSRSARGPNAQARSHNGNRSSRSLSSSPPPAGPPDVDPMIEGLDGDDVYMMVEDEFYSTAQTFTAHLHHAEYKRQMKAAREKKRAGIPDAAVPEDATRTVRGKLERRKLEERQRSGVKSLTTSGAFMSSDREDEEEAELEMGEEKKVRDPWAGTSLAPLMRYDSAGRVSLKGLERIGGATRAAQGFGPAGGRDTVEVEGDQNRSRKGDGTRVEEDDGGSGLNGSGRIRREAGQRRADAFEETRSKSSFAEETKPASKEMPAPLGPTKDQGPLPKPNLVKKGDPVTIKSKSDVKSAKTGPKKYKSFIDSLDDFDEDMFDQIQAQVSQERAAPEKPQIKRDDKGKVKEDRSSRYDEIPIFLA